MACSALKPTKNPAATPCTQRSFSATAIDVARFSTRAIVAAMRALGFWLLLTTLPLLGGERTEQLRKALAGVDRVTIRDRYAPENRKPPFKIAGAPIIRDLAAKLDIDDVQSGGILNLSDSYVITFYKGDEVALEIYYDHQCAGLLPRGDRFAEGRFVLTEASGAAWRKWFKKHGESRFHDQHEANLAEQRRKAKLRTDILSLFPPKARTAIENREEEGFTVAFPPGQALRVDQFSPTAGKLLKAFPDRKSLTQALTKAFGLLSASPGIDGTWSRVDYFAQPLLECATTITTDEFLHVLESRDELVLLGAARLFFTQGSASELPAGLRDRFGAKLARVVFRNDKSYNSPITLQGIGGIAGEHTRKLLVEIAEERIFVLAPSPYELVKGPSAPVLACLQLALRNAPEVVGLVAKLAKKKDISKADKVATLVTSALLGQPVKLDRSIFEVYSASINVAAMKALERRHDKASLDLLITHGTGAASREESVLTIERMTGRHWFKNEENERAEWHIDEIQKWWKENRETFQLPPRKK